MSVPVSEGISWLGVAEAAEAAAVSARTMHRWISDGTVASMVNPQGRRLVDPASLPRPRQPAGQDGANGASPTGCECERLRDRLLGAHSAAKIHARRAVEAREESARVEGLMREIKLKLEEENAYLKERLASRDEEAHQLRVLLHQSELNVNRLVEQMRALPGEKPKRKWLFWRKG